jgi:hypothetical protein
MYDMVPPFWVWLIPVFSIDHSCNNSSADAVVDLQLLLLLGRNTPQEARQLHQAPTVTFAVHWYALHLWACQLLVSIVKCAERGVVPLPL